MTASNLSPAVLYAAKSTEDKRGSIPGQLADCRALAERESFAVIGEFTDENFSAYHGNRGPGLENAKAAAVAAAAKHGECMFVAQHSDRIARGDGVTAQHFAEVFFWARRHRVRIWTTQSGREVDDVLRASLEGERDHEDSKRKSASVAAGQQRRAERGLPKGGRRPYGYRYVPPDRETGRESAFEIVPAEAAIVKRIYSEFVGGKSQRRIAADLRAENAPTLRPGSKWHQGTVSQIVRNPVYVGRFRHGGQVYDGGFEPIIDRETWQRAEALRAAHTRSATGRTKNAKDARRAPGRRAAADFLFQGGHLRCGSCGEAMMSRTANRTHGDKTYRYEVYRCYGRQAEPDSCDMRPVKRAELDAAVFEYFADVGLDVAATRARLESAMSDRLTEIRELLTDAERQERQLADAIDRLDRDYVAGKISAERFESRAAKFEAEREAAAANVERLRARERDIGSGAIFRDAEAETVGALAAIQAAIAAQVTEASAGGTDAVRAALMRLFDHFTVYQRTDRERATLPAHEREAAEHAAASLEAPSQAVELPGGRFVVYGEIRPEAAADLGEAWEPIFRREPLFVESDVLALAM